MGLEINNDTLSKINELYQKASKTESKVQIDMTVDSNGKKVKRKPKERQYDYRLGPREGNTRIITPDSVATLHSGYSISSGNYRIGSKVLRQRREDSPQTAVDGHVGSSKQAAFRGDCYFLAEINAIRNLNNGQEILGKCVTDNPNGSFTVTLPGAVKIRQSYAARGLKCEVTGTYHISAAAIKKAVQNAGKTYSKGEIEVIALELAMESYRAEMVKTNQLNGNSQNSRFSAETNVSSPQNRTNGDYLSSGQTYDAAFLLTGKKSDIYYAKQDKMRNLKRYQDGQYGYITREQMAQRTGADISMYKPTEVNYKGIPEVSHSTSSEFGLKGMLNKYQGHENEYSLTCSVQVQKGDAATPDDGYHALTVVKITNDTVYCANPWHPDKIEPIPRKDFERMAYGFKATNLKSSSPSAVGQQIGSTVGSILGRLGSQLSDQSSQNVNPGKVTRLIDALNQKRGNDTDSTPQLNFDGFARIFNNISKVELDDSQKEKLNKLFSSLSTTKDISEEDIALMRYFEEHFGK